MKIFYDTSDKQWEACKNGIRVTITPYSHTDNKGSLLNIVVQEEENHAEKPFYQLEVKVKDIAVPIYKIANFFEYVLDNHSFNHYEEIQFEDLLCPVCRIFNAPLDAYLRNDGPYGAIIKVAKCRLDIWSMEYRSTNLSTKYMPAIDSPRNLHQ